jgi:hypothetical protein
LAASFMTAFIAAIVTSSRIPTSSSQLSKLDPTYGLFLFKEEFLRVEAAAVARIERQ